MSAPALTAAAARATLAAGSCRVRVTTTYEPPLEHDYSSVEEGEGSEFGVDLEGLDVALPPHRGSRAPVLHGSAHPDEAGRLARVRWTRSDRARPRAWPRPTGHREWRDLELWEYGLAVDIPIPDAAPPGRARDLVPFAGAVAAQARVGARA